MKVFATIVVLILAMLSFGSGHETGPYQQRLSATDDDKRMYISIPPEAFHAIDDQHRICIHGGMGGAYSTVENNYSGMVAPLNLPHGWTVVEMRAFFFDESQGNIRVALETLHMEEKPYTTMAHVSSKSNRGYMSASDKTIGSSTIDNTKRSYFLQVSSKQWDGDDLRFKGAWIACVDLRDRGKD